MSTIDLPILNGTSFRAKFETELLAAPVIRTLQINIGYVCNLACRHCHVESSPARIAPEDNMSEEDKIAREVEKQTKAKDKVHDEFAFVNNYDEEDLQDDEPKKKKRK